MKWKEKLSSTFKKLRETLRWKFLQIESDAILTPSFSANKWHLLIFRAILLAYWLPIWIYRLATFHLLKEVYSDFLTNWTDTLICFYLLSVVLLHFVDRTQFKINSYVAVIFQIIYEICLTASFLVVVGFWASAGINSTLENDYGTQTWSFSPENPPLMVQNFHGHIMVSVAMILELIWNRTPVNIYHVIFLWIFGSAYGLATFIAFKIDPKRDEVYPILNWQNDGFFLDGEKFPLTSSWILVLFIFPISGVFHCLFWALTKFKMRLIAKRMDSCKTDSI